MDLALWIVAGLLAAAYLAGGTAKLIVSTEKWATFPAADGPRLQRRHVQSHRSP